MPGTATNWSTLAIAQSAGQLWVDVALPAAGATITLFTDGTPDSAVNPLARHLGMTREGAQFMAKPKYGEYFADEFAAPIKRSVDAVELAISAELLQVTDTTLLELLTPGMGTKTTGAGFERVTLGLIPILYKTVALIFPTNDVTTKYVTFLLYRANNDAGVEIKNGRKILSGTPVMFKGLEITTRPVTDSYGQINKQV